MLTIKVKTILISIFIFRQMGLSAMPSQADLMRAFCVEASVQVALETCGQGLIKQHGLPAISGPTPSG